MAKRRRPTQDSFPAEPAAGHGLLERRRLLTHGMALLGASSLAAGAVTPADAAEPPDKPAWMQFPGAPFSGYGNPAKYESKVTRTNILSQPGTTGSGSSRTPLEALDGMITPSGLHFERHHSGIPDIDPDKHRLLIHGLVQRPLIFTVEALLRYPMVSHIYFLECSATAGPCTAPLRQHRRAARCTAWCRVVSG